MLKVEIVMDEEKILAEGKYSLEDIYFTIDELFAKKNLKKIDNGVYSDNGSDQDYANLWINISALRKAEWFMSNTKKWLWYNSDDGNDESDFSIEDLKSYFGTNVMVGV
ncbi:MAG: hypothetical protein RSA79_05400 [Oscillospiraceae bacterium]